jgi:hypothetical protein
VAPVPLAFFVLPLGTMRLRRLALLVGLYLSLDLTNPFLGCAFNFNLEESVDGVSRQHGRLILQSDHGATPAPVEAETGGTVRTVPVQQPAARALAEWLVALRQGHAGTSDPPSSLEDH